MRSSAPRGDWDRVMEGCCLGRLVRCGQQLAAVRYPVWCSSLRMTIRGGSGPSFRTISAGHSVGHISRSSSTASVTP